jgi:hypothetical protein
VVRMYIAMLDKLMMGYKRKDVNGGGKS